MKNKTIKKRRLSSWLVSLGIGAGAIAGIGGAMACSPNETTALENNENITVVEDDEKLNEAEQQIKDLQEQLANVQMQDRYQKIYEQINAVSQMVDNPNCLDVQKAMSVLSLCKTNLDLLKSHYKDDKNSIQLYDSVLNYKSIVEKVICEYAVKQGAALAFDSKDFYKVGIIQYGDDAGEGNCYVNNVKSTFAMETPSYLKYLADDVYIHNLDLSTNEYTVSAYPKNQLSLMDTIEQNLVTNSKNSIRDENATITYRQYNNAVKQYVFNVENTTTNENLKFTFLDNGELVQFIGTTLDGVGVEYNFETINEKQFNNNYNSIVDKINEYTSHDEITK